MVQKVLIPTDFTIESLNLLKAAATMNSRPKSIVLYHAIHLSESITELLFFSRSKFIQSTANDDFHTAVKIIRNRYASIITEVEVDLFVGRSGRAFENFVIGNKVDLILIPEAYQFRQPSDKSIDPLLYVHRCNKRTAVISWKRNNDTRVDDTLSEVFQFDPGLK